MLSEQDEENAVGSHSVFFGLKQLFLGEFSVGNMAFDILICGRNESTGISLWYPVGYILFSNCILG